MVYPLCRGCDEPEVCIDSTSCKYRGLDFVRTAQTAVSLRGDSAANDDWWLRTSHDTSPFVGVKARTYVLAQLRQLVLDNPDLFPPDFLTDPL
jgi:hypothetical protein